MKRSAIYWIIGGIAAFFGISYFLKSRTDKKAAITPQYNLITARYSGADISHMGKSLTAGDLITGTLYSDGSMNYLMYGAGIVASSKLINIPASDFTELGKI